jgi:negative regulator of flagellin synthesis FlgM
MEIHNNQSIGIDAYVNQVHDKNKVGAPENKPEKTAIKSDTVVISDAAKRIQAARKQLDEIPDVREDKVSQLRSQIQNGTYEINAEKIAGKMIKEGLFNDALK